MLLLFRRFQASAKLAQLNFLATLGRARGGGAGRARGRGRRAKDFKK